MTVYKSSQRGYCDVVVPVPAATATVGDTIVIDGITDVVIAVDDFQPGDHRHSPIANWMIARCVSTRTGDRWFGHRPDLSYRGAEVLSAHPEGVRFGG